MGISNKQIGWSTESGLLYDIIKELDRLIKITSMNTGGAVSSVFGRTGDVIAQSGDYTTTLVTEGTNLYYTNARGIGSTLTGYVSGAGTITAADTILSAIQKLNGNIAGLASTYWALGGNTVGAIKNFGTLDNYALPFITNNIERGRFDTAGNFVIGATSALGKFHVRGTGTGTNYLLYADNGALTTRFSVKENGHVNIVGNLSINVNSSLYPFYLEPFGNSNPILAYLDATTLTPPSQNVLLVLSSTANGTAIAEGFTRDGIIVGYAQGQYRTAFVSRIAHKNANGININTNQSLEGIRNYDGYLATITYQVRSEGGNGMTGSTSKPLLWIQKIGRRNAYDHTGAFIELSNAMDSGGASGDFINCNNGINTLFKTDYTGKTTVQLLDSSTNTVLYANKLARYSTGTPANNIGVGMEFEVETAVGNNEIGATIEVVVTDTTATAENFDVYFKNMTAGAVATTKFKMKSDGTLETTVAVDPTTVTVDAGTCRMGVFGGRPWVKSAAGEIQYLTTT